MSQSSLDAQERSVRRMRRAPLVFWIRALAGAVCRAFRVDLAQATLIPALRSALGFGLPLAVAVALGDVLLGVSFASGALGAGSIGLTATRRERIRTMLWACVGIALSGFVGSLVGRNSWLTILVTGVWGIGAGLLVTLGPSALVVGLQSGIALIILAHLALPPASAAPQAALMFAGALFQTLLALLPLPWRQAAAERSALRAVFQRLAGYAAEPLNDRLTDPLRDALVAAAGVVEADTNDDSITLRFGRLVAEAEHIRLNLLILRRWKQYVAQLRDVTGAPVHVIDDLLDAAVVELGEVAAALSGRPASPARTHQHRSIKHTLDALRQYPVTAQYQELAEALIAVGATLRDRLYRAKKLARTPQYRRKFRPGLRLHTLTLTPVRYALISIRANLTLRAAVFRHSLRLGATLALTTALYRLTPLPFSHGYWIPITALLVLRPDFSTTFTRGTARLVGTVLGAAVATVLVRLVAPASAPLVALAIVTAYLAYAVLLLNYALFSACITIETVLLLTLANVVPQAAAFDRVLTTLLGGVIALVLYMVWPTWEHPRVFDVLATYIEQLRRYLGLVLAAYIDPRSYDLGAIEMQRRRTRLARANAAAAVERLHSEPHQRDVDLADGLRATGQAIAASTLALEGYLHLRNDAGLLRELLPFAQASDTALSAILDRLRDPRSRVAGPELQPVLSALQNAVHKRYPAAAPPIDIRVLLIETKRISHNLDTLYQLSVAGHGWPTQGQAGGSNEAGGEEF
jgi:uncharacterized membrane protein YccC